MSLVFNFKCYFILLILIYDKIRLSFAALYPSGPCKNCSLVSSSVWYGCPRGILELIFAGYVPLWWKVLPFQAQIGEISGKRIRATSAYEQQGAREEGGWGTNSTTRMANGKGTRHSSTVLGSATTENRTALKLGLQQVILQLMNINHTGTCIQNVNQCRSAM